MKNTIKHFAVFSCFALGASLAQAEPEAHDMQGTLHEQKVGQHFKEMDSSGDGTITKAEFDAFHNQHFQDIDSNKDGHITPEEMREGHRENIEESRSKHFDDADANRDGALSREEAKKLPMISRRFNKIDTNKDGKLSREEMDDSMKKMRRTRN